MGDKVNQLNKAMPATNNVMLGTAMEQLQQNFNALLLKLDADFDANNTAVTNATFEENYSATLAVTPISQR